MNVDAERGVANQITPGDHVDIATTVDDGKGGTTTGYLLQNVKVLAVGPSTDAADDADRRRRQRAVARAAHLRGDARRRAAQ